MRIKELVFALIAVVTIPGNALAQANWVAVSEASDGRIYHLDTSSVRSSDGYVTYYQMITYLDGTFSIGRILGSCQQDVIMILGYRDFNESGEAVYEETQPAEPTQAFPGTIGYSMLQAACGTY